jgi:hypothetical protein
VRADAEHPDTSHCFHVSFVDTNDNVIIERRYVAWPHAHIISPSIVGSRQRPGWALKSRRLDLEVRPGARLNDFAQLLRVSDLMANDIGHLGVWLGNHRVFRSASPKRSCDVMHDIDIFVGERLA